jgi:hypothetical protein
VWTETSKELKRQDKREGRRNVVQARRPPFKVILCMRITDSGVMRAAVVRLQVDVRGQSGNRDGLGVGEDVDEYKSTVVEGIPTEAS